MAKYILYRILIAIPLLLGITVITFTFINIAPGDPVAAMINPEDQMTGVDIDQLRENMGLNQPVPVRYAIWLGQLVQGNLGYSYNTGEPVSRRIGVRLLATLELIGTALVFSTLLGITVGVIAALNQYTVWDYVATVFALITVSVPPFFIALIALYVFALKLGWFPTFGMQTIGVSGAGAVLDNLHHLALPATILSLETMAGLTRYTRSSMLEVLRQEYVTTARAKGLRNAIVVIKHAFRNALLPVITITSLRLPSLLGGAIIIETMFQWPGMGLLAISAIQQRDYPVLMGLTFFTATLVLLSNLIADVLYAYADPRIRYS
jgi:peptide/nickel transport system permease protein